MRRILLVLGTRPEAIKLAPVALRLAAAPGLRPIICVTAQHRGLLDQVLAAHAIRPDFDLDVMRDAQGLSEVTAAILHRMPAVLAAARPDRVLVQGDTTTAFAAALAAFHAGIPVGHVEAGLRTGRATMPFPEEANRRLVGVLADLHFAPTPRARDNLLAEGVPAGRIHVTGNTGIDALLDALALLEADPARRAAAEAALPPPIPGRRLLLVTAHRRESIADGGLARIAEGLSLLAARGDVEIALPLHPNPAVAAPLRAALGGRPGLHLLPPLGHLAFVALMRRAAVIVTDSGGVQEEAPALGKPVLVIRDATERSEALETGAARLIGTDPARLAAEVAALLDAPPAPPPALPAATPFGDGRAAARIVARLADERADAAL
jgi:UDP-N-acetylglucosamine 2-epimerase